MNAPSGWRRLLTVRSNVRGDVDDELRFHLETRVRSLIADGLSPAAARAEAEREFGDLRAIRQACVAIDERRQRRGNLLETLHQMRKDFTFALRALRRTPGFTFAAGACLALGIGLTTTIFSAVNGILLRPLPYPHADRLVAVYAQNSALGYHGTNISFPDYLSWRDENRTFEALGMWTWSSFSLSGDLEAERVNGARVTPNLFPLLGVHPLLGSLFAPETSQPGRDRQIILSYGLWQRRYAGDRGIVGRTITVDGAPHTVVAVMPPRFNFPDRGDAWKPFAAEPDAQPRENRIFAGAIGRLRDGVTLEQSAADLATVSARLQRAHPNENRGWAAEPISLRQDLTGDLRLPLLVFLGAVLLVLLIACANVANLMLARSAARQRELAIRVAIGAGRGQLMRQILLESIVLALGAGSAGALLAVGGVRLLHLALPADTPFYIDFSIDGTALLFAAGISIVTAVLFGTAPATRAAAVDLGRVLREDTHGSGESGRRGRLRGILVIAEVALSVVLMIGATLLIRSYRAFVDTPLGFDERGILTMRISLPPASYADAARRLAYFDGLLARVRTIPGVVSAGSAQGIPFSGWNIQAELSAEGRPETRPGDALIAHYQWVTPTYFATIGVPLVRGRGFTAADRDTASPPVLVNETLVMRVFPGVDPIGKRVRIGGAQDPWVTIVGVLHDYRHYRLPEPMGPAVFYPYASQPTYTQTLVIRTTVADPLSLAPVVRSIMRQLDPAVPAYSVQTMAQVVERSRWRQRLQSQVLGAFAALALLLATIGLYGVVSYAVTQRTRELGVRIALGATRHQVLALVLRQGTRVIAAGIGLGLLAAIALTRSISTLLYGVHATDPLTFVGVPVILGVVALFACFVPARRATRVDPLVAMRAE